MNTINTELFNQIYKNTKDKLNRKVYNILKDHAATEDVVQETFRKFVLQDFEKIENHYEQWLYTVAKNTAFKVSDKRKRFVELNEEWDSIDDTPSVFDNMALNELKKVIPKLMKKLTEKQKKAIRYKFYKNYSYNQIGEKLNMGIGNVGFQLNFAINTMKKEFSKINKKYGYV